MSKEKKEEIEEVKNVEENKAENKPEDNKNVDQEKVMKILKMAKEKGKITYGELATQLGEINPEQIDKVFDAFEQIGVDVLKDDLDE